MKGIHTQAPTQTPTQTHTEAQIQCTFTATIQQSSRFENITAKWANNYVYCKQFSFAKDRIFEKWNNRKSARERLGDWIEWMDVCMCVYVVFLAYFQRILNLLITHSFHHCRHIHSTHSLSFSVTRLQCFATPLSTAMVRSKFTQQCHICACWTCFCEQCFVSLWQCH